ncbi:MAG: sugar phosphate isomerase/epimerase [Planctomycetaceae bacterium]|nr:sugar phosphate isomerase/epimerase [Planctomycetaceae bacterium]
MPPQLTLPRRQFLHSALAAAAASTIALPAVAAVPPVRNGKPHFKLSLAAYSFNRYLPTGWPKPQESNASMTLEEFIEFCAEMNLDGTELTSYYFPPAVTGDYLIHLKELTFRLGLDVSGTAIGNDFCLPPGADRDFHLAMTKAWIDYSAILGAPVIRIFAGSVPQGDTEEAALDRCVAGINECVAYAATKGVVLALENHGGITATADQLLTIVERVDSSPWFGINFDSGNFSSADPYSELERIAPYAMNAQLKVSVTAAGQRQPADFGRIVNILKQAGYRGYLVLEYEESDEPRERIPVILDQLRELIV